MCTEELLSLDGCRKHPHNNLWAKEGCSYFLNARGQKLVHEYAPKMRAKSKDRGYTAPNLRNYKPRLCHVLMGEIFYGERPTFIDRKGNPYFGLCHHLIEDPLNYCPENLLCWLTYSEHHKADNRRRALEKVVTEGNLNGFDYAILRELQDPRTMSDADFDARMEYLLFMYSCDFDPRIFNAADFHHFFSMPLEDFKTFFAKYKKQPTL